MNVLEAYDITKEFADGTEMIPVLRGVSLSLQRGEIVSLEGPSGSGKTTLLSIVGCILTATSGRVIIDGNAVNPDRARDLPKIRRKSIGFVFQQHNLIPALTAAENVEYALNLRGMRGANARTEAERVLDHVGRRQRRTAHPRDLSGGQRQRVPSPAACWPAMRRSSCGRADRQPRFADRRADPGTVPQARQGRGPRGAGGDA